MSRMKRWITLMLVMVYAMTLLPTTAMAATPKNEAEIEERINELITKLGAKQFTVNRKPCRDPREPGHGCSNCDTANIVSAPWFKEQFGTIKSSQFPYTGRSCNGFAWFAEWYIFRADNKDSVTRKVIKEDVKYNYETISKYAKKGDLITAKRSDGQHTFVVIGYDEKGVMVLDSNWSGKQCTVQAHRINFGGKYKTCKISRCYSVAEGKAPVVEENKTNQSAASTLSFSLPSKSYPAGTLRQGEKFVLKGTIASNYKITHVKGEIINSAGKAVQTKEIKNGKSKTVSIQSSILNKQLKFGTLPADTYTLKYSAKDSSGKTAEISKAFAVADKNGVVPTTPVTPSKPETAKKYTITLDAQGGSVSKSSMQIEAGKSYGNMPMPQKNGYEFGGWFISRSFTGKALTAGTTILPEDHTIYARWIKVQEEPETVTKPESKPSIPALPDCNGKHTKGSFVRTEDEHPHADVYKCKVCGEQFAAESTKCISTCKICNPGKQLIKAPAAKVIVDTSKTLKVGSKGDDVKRLQMNLNTMGFNAGSADSAFGNGTKEAVIRFQKDQGLEADGIAGKKTLNRMVDIAVEVQTRLYQLGYFTEKIDGVMGSKTQAALKAFQKDNGLKQDGLATAAVRNALAKAVS